MSFTAFGTLDHRALVITRVAAPWWAPAFLITRRFIGSIPEYSALRSLHQKAYILSEDGKFGGVYTWADRSAAEAYFDEGWHRGVRERRGVDGEVRVFDVVSTVGGRSSATGRALSPHAVRGEAFVSWIHADKPDAPAEVEAALGDLAKLHSDAPGLVAASFVSESDSVRQQGVVPSVPSFGAVTVWASQSAARSFWTGARQAEAAQALRAPVTLTWFSAPVLLDARGAQQGDHGLVHAPQEGIA
jgi:hypothetical protein